MWMMIKASPEEIGKIKEEMKTKEVEVFEEYPEMEEQMKKAKMIYRVNKNQQMVEDTLMEWMVRTGVEAKEDIKIILKNKHDRRSKSCDLISIEMENKELKQQILNKYQTENLKNIADSLNESIYVREIDFKSEFRIKAEKINASLRKKRMAITVESEKMPLSLVKKNIELVAGRQRFVFTFNQFEKIVVVIVPHFIHKVTNRTIIMELEKQTGVMSLRTFEETEQDFTNTLMETFENSVKEIKLKTLFAN